MGTAKCTDYCQCLSGTSKGDRIGLRKPEICDRDRVTIGHQKRGIGVGVKGVTGSDAIVAQ